MRAELTEDNKSDLEKTKSMNFYKTQNQTVRSGEETESRMAACKGPEAEAELLR